MNYSSQSQTNQSQIDDTIDNQWSSEEWIKRYHENVKLWIDWEFNKNNHLKKARGNQLRDGWYNESQWLYYCEPEKLDNRDRAKILAELTVENEYLRRAKKAAKELTDIHNEKLAAEEKNKRMEVCQQYIAININKWGNHNIETDHNYEYKDDKSQQLNSLKNKGPTTLLTELTKLFTESEKRIQRFHGDNRKAIQAEYRLQGNRSVLTDEELDSIRFTQIVNNMYTSIDHEEVHQNMKREMEKRHIKKHAKRLLWAFTLSHDKMMQLPENKQIKYAYYRYYFLEKMNTQCIKAGIKTNFFNDELNTAINDITKDKKINPSDLEDLRYVIRVEEENCNKIYNTTNNYYDNKLDPNNINQQIANKLDALDRKLKKYEDEPWFKKEFIEKHKLDGTLKSDVFEPRNKAYDFLNQQKNSGQQNPMTTSSMIDTSTLLKPEDVLRGLGEADQKLTKLKEELKKKLQDEKDKAMEDQQDQQNKMQEEIDRLKQQLISKKAKKEQKILEEEKERVKAALEKSKKKKSDVKSLYYEYKKIMDELKQEIVGDLKEDNVKQFLDEIQNNALDKVRGFIENGRENDGPKDEESAIGILNDVDGNIDKLQKDLAVEKIKAEENKATAEAKEQQNIKEKAEYQNIHNGLKKKKEELEKKYKDELPKDLFNTQRLNELKKKLEEELATLQEMINDKDNNWDPNHAKSQCDIGNNDLQKLQQALGMAKMTSEDAKQKKNHLKHKLDKLAKEKDELLKDENEDTDLTKRFALDTALEMANIKLDSVLQDALPEAQEKYQEADDLFQELKDDLKDKQDELSKAKREIDKKVQDLEKRRDQLLKDWNGYNGQLKFAGDKEIEIPKKLEKKPEDLEKVERFAKNQENQEDNPENIDEAQRMLNDVDRDLEILEQKLDDQIKEDADRRKIELEDKLNALKEAAEKAKSDPLYKDKIDGNENNKNVAQKNIHDPISKINDFLNGDGTKDGVKPADKKKYSDMMVEANEELEKLNSFLEEQKDLADKKKLDEEENQSRIDDENLLLHQEMLQQQREEEERRRAMKAEEIREDFKKEKDNISNLLGELLFKRLQCEISNGRLNEEQIQNRKQWANFTDQANKYIESINAEDMTNNEHKGFLAAQQAITNGFTEWGKSKDSCYGEKNGTWINDQNIKIILNNKKDDQERIDYIIQTNPDKGSGYWRAKALYELEKAIPKLNSTMMANIYREQLKKRIKEMVNMPKTGITAKYNAHGKKIKDGMTKDKVQLEYRKKKSQLKKELLDVENTIQQKNQNRSNSRGGMRNSIGSGNGFRQQISSPSNNNQQFIHSPYNQNLDDSLNSWYVSGGRDANINLPKISNNRRLTNQIFSNNINQLQQIQQDYHIQDDSNGIDMFSNHGHESANQQILMSSKSKKRKNGGKKKQFVKDIIKNRGEGPQMIVHNPNQYVRQNRQTFDNKRPTTSSHLGGLFNQVGRAFSKGKNASNKITGMYSNFD